MSIEATRKSFEASFSEKEYYNKQTQDQKHLENIINAIYIKDGLRILDLGCGSGYMTFPLAKKNKNISVVGLDIVSDTLERNNIKAKEDGLDNIEFVSYEGYDFPFENASFDLVVSRYALHHFPDIYRSMREVARVLKPGGRLFISDPRPNACDKTRFVDEYMQLKNDGHVKFYTKGELEAICGDYGIRLVSNFTSAIRFPKKKSSANGFELVLRKHEKSIIDSYELIQTEDEIWVTEQVNNLIFVKEW